MKNLLLFALLFASLTVKSQTNPSVKNADGPFITFDTATVDTETNIYVFTGNVNFKDSIVDIKNAQKLTINKNTNELTAIGFSDAGIDGTITAFMDGTKCYPGTIDYTLGSRILYLNKNCH